MSKYIGTPVVSLSTDTVDVTGDITTTDATPEVIIVNDTHEDTDGGREGKVTFKGQASGGEETTLAQIQASHDGTSDDEKGDLIFKTNDGSDGASPTEAMRIDSAQNIITSKTVDINTASRTLPVLKFTHTNSGFDNFQIGGGTPGVSNAGFTIRDVDASANRLVITSDGNVGIGTSSPTVSNGKGLVIADATAARLKLCDTTTGEGASDGVQLGHSGGIGFLFNHENEAFQFGTNNTERMRIDSAGRLLIGTTTEGNANADDLTISGSGNIGMTIRSTNSGESNIYFSDGTSGGPEYVGYAAYNHGDNTLRIGTNAVERMRIRNDGYFRIGDANSQAETYTGANVIMTSIATTFGNHGVDIAQGSYTGAYNVLYFRNGNGGVGYIQTNGSSTTYSTGSDYRLKENVTDISDGITRVKQLKPSRFNFIADADKTVDGFLAHEAATVVPEAVTGTKDAVQVWKEHEKDELPDGVSVGDNKLDDVGNTIPEIQGIDQGKLVPLLTAALQEAIAKIETLETKVAALEGE